MLNSSLSAQLAVEWPTEMTQVKLTPGRELATPSHAFHPTPHSHIIACLTADHAVGHLWLLIINAAIHRVHIESIFAASPIPIPSLPKFPAGTPCAINAVWRGALNLNLAGSSRRYSAGCTRCPIPIRSLNGSSRSRTRCAKRQRWWSIWNSIWKRFHEEVLLTLHGAGGQHRRRPRLRSASCAPHK